MRRREFITLLSGAATWPLAARAQQQAISKLGYLGGASASGGQELLNCFLARLRELGWVEGKDFAMEIRWTEGISERFSPLAVELVRSNPKLIVANSTPAAQAVQRATANIPVVFVAVSDPVASGIVASLARPGRNITGVSNFLPATSGKLIELLKTAAPEVSHFGVLYNPTNAGKVLELHELQATGQSLGVAIEPLEVRSATDFDGAFSKVAPSHCDALIVLQEGVTLGSREQITKYAEKKRLPAIYQTRGFVEVGGLMSYGLNYCQHFRRTATYVDKILKGAQPADLPVELPTTFELVINQKAAKRMDLTISESFLLRADEVIE